MSKFITLIFVLFFTGAAFAEVIYFSGEREYSDSSFFRKTEIIYHHDDKKISVCGIHSDSGLFFIKYEFKIGAEGTLFYNGATVGKLRRNGFYAVFTPENSDVEHDISLSWSGREKKFNFTHDIDRLDLLMYWGKSVDSISNATLEFCHN